MESLRLFLIRIILSTIVLSLVLAGSNKKHKQNNYNIESAVTNEKMKMTINLNKTGRNKSPSRTTRGVYRRNWSKTYGQYNNMPPYLVFNRKTGSYYPYYTYPKENSIRRNGVKGLKKWSH